MAAAPGAPVPVATSMPTPTPMSVPLPAGLRSRALALADLDAVMSLELRAYPWPWTRGNFVDSLVAGHRAQGVFDSDGTLVAHAIAMPVVDEWHLLNLAVRPEAQGRGLARWLLVDLARAALPGTAVPAVALWLEVRVSNDRARRLYERSGFEAVGRRRGYYPCGSGPREDAVVMRCGLPDGLRAFDRAADRVTEVATGVATDRATAGAADVAAGGAVEGPTARTAAAAVAAVEVANVATPRPSPSEAPQRSVPGRPAANRSAGGRLATHPSPQDGTPAA